MTRNPKPYISDEPSTILDFKEALNKAAYIMIDGNPYIIDNIDDAFGIINCITCSDPLIAERTSFTLGKLIEIEDKIELIGLYRMKTS